MESNLFSTTSSIFISHQALRLQDSKLGPAPRHILDSLENYLAEDLCGSSYKLDGKGGDNVGYSMGREYGKIFNPLNPCLMPFLRVEQESIYSPLSHHNVSTGRGGHGSVRDEN
ncbi:hypothetical protein MTR_4g063890 [Medicago truncatula]|uniref:Uncharacterized protein n=1 Tax=Medicago truncatula TaxID=3880 RepID=A0A072UK75_MEDTR|nr:hypothetical protein MTR_4g063890 [Medicago truncatula]